MEVRLTNQGNSRAKWQTDQGRKDMVKFLQDTGVQFSLES